MTTTIMKDSIVGDSWIAEMCRLNPVQHVLNDAGQPSGNILTGPVRLAFCDSLFTAKPQMRTDPNSAKKHSCVALFTPYTDLALFWAEYYRIAASDFASHYNAGTGQYHGIDNPVFDQGSKAQYSGFTPGCMASTFSSNYKPPIVDPRNNPIVDESKVYAGVWAIVAVNCYPSGKNTPRKGPRFGLQTVMVIGDDKPLAGGSPDPRTQFKGVSVKAPTVVPGQAFGQPVQTPGQPPAPMAAYYPPQGMPQGAPGTVPAMVPAHVPPPPPGKGDDDLSAFM